MNRRWGVLAAAAAVTALAACSGPVTAPGSAYASHAAAVSSPPGTGTAGTGPAGRSGPAGSARPPVLAALTRVPSPAVSVLAATTPALLTAQLALTLFRSAPVVVVASPGGQTLRTAAQAAAAVHAPLLLDSDSDSDSDTGSGAAASGSAAGAGAAQLAASLRKLHPAVVLAVGVPSAGRRALAAQLPGVRLVTSTTGLPATGTPAALTRTAVLIPAPEAGGKGPVSTSAAVRTAAGATARAAGAAVIGLSGTDPRAAPAAIAELARLHPEAVVAVGAQFGPAARLASRVAVAETGRQLPGGGQVLFPGRRLVALYGHPGTPGLGVLGQQDLAASITRARRLAAQYQPLSRVPVVPAFEIIATVAEASPGPDGSYSFATPVAELLPWVRRATADGLYVVLDLQPGRASLLAQAEHYQALLELPGVGLALDPEWKLQPGQKPLRQIGHVDAREVNRVIGWLAALTARYRLPQKLLVLHQFQLAMIRGEQALDTSRDDLAVVIHMDGQGPPAVKQQTWNAVTAAAPPGVFFGWKDFLVKDHPMLTPGQTTARTPAPVMISYQ